ncbi:MAG: KOW domain-containing RNA-binding protein [Clostridia bacterium]|nr:KOW domain-containing RNA-binding protein [Clostridia bacterium]
MGKLCDIKLSVGDLAVSLKGHDTGRLYVVIAEISADFVLVCDGDKRLVDNPKQKRRKHLKYLTHVDANDNISIKKAVEEQNAKRR